MNPVIKKLFYKGQKPLLILKAPPEFSKIAKDFGAAVHKAPKRTYAFALAFGTSMAEWEKIGKEARKFLAEDAVFWAAYPKGTSKKYKGADVNRDSGQALMQKHGLDGVSLVALDEDWSAMRFKVKA